MTLRNRLVAHRGNCVEFRENSLAAIRSALELGVQYVEIDVQLSADGVPVLLHDANLSRVFGVDRNALEMTWAQLEAIGVASLAQADELFVRYPDVTAFVELKADSLQAFGAPTVVTATVADLSCNYALISFDMAALIVARAKYQVPVGWIITDLSTETRRRCEAADPDFVFCDQLILTAPHGPPLWTDRGVWVSYEVRTHKLAQQLINLGVSLFETMDVRGMLK